ncbi:nuclear transport factor 2 family protein [Streptomyces cellulosae]
MESNEKIIREAYRLAEGDILDGDGFLALFTEDGSFNDMSTSQTFRGEQIPQVIAGLARSFPDVHRELLAVHAFGDVVAVELRTRARISEGFRLRPARSRRPGTGSTCRRRTSGTSVTERSKGSTATTR